MSWVWSVRVNSPWNQRKTRMRCPLSSMIYNHDPIRICMNRKNYITTRETVYRAIMKRDMARVADVLPDDAHCPMRISSSLSVM